MQHANKDLTIGIVNNIDYLPVIDAIESGEMVSGVRLVTDTVKGLHDRFLAGQLDIAPLPSIEYAEHFHDCLILPDVSVAGTGANRVLLFSKEPVTDMAGRTISVPDTAATSFVLLKILINHYYQVDVKYRRDVPDLKGMLAGTDAALLYGEKALQAKNANPGYHILDVGALWREFTAEPMVYALWVVREEYARKHPVQVDFLVKALHASRNLNMKNIPRLVEKARLRYNLPKELLEGYFASMRSGFDDSYRRALLKYYAHAQICGLIPAKVTLKVWGEQTI